MMIDISTLIFAVCMNLWVFIPERKKDLSAATATSETKSAFWQDVSFGFKFIAKRKPLLMLLMVFLATNFFAGFGKTLFSPYVLARTNNNALAMGTVETFFGVGGLIGGLMLSLWSIPGKKVTALLAGMILSDFGMVLIGFSRIVPVMCVGAVFASFGGVMANTHSQAIWQSIVPIDMQGRVFSARRFIAQALSGIPMFLSGPIVDNLLVPRFQHHNAVTNLLGTGPAGAISFLIVAGALLSILVSFWGFSNHYVMHVEELADPSLSVDKTQ
jgi:Na+/melibiose symporter-like transporter